MAETIREVMTPHPTVLDAGATIVDAARTMRDGDHGDVLVSKDGKVCGIVTDRDIVVRGLTADVSDLASVQLGDLCTMSLQSLTPDDDVADAVKLMREQAIRRIPVLDGGKPVGIVSIGDLALEEDGSSALAAISAAPGNN